MAKVNPDKLVKNLEVNSGNANEVNIYWENPTELKDFEEVVVTRRKDAFSVEIRHPNYEDRYTDLAQVEVFRGYNIYCSQLVKSGDNELQIGPSNAFQPSGMSELPRDNNLVGRLIRDSNSQVFRIVSNTEDKIVWENIATNNDKQLEPNEGPFAILVEYPKDAKETTIQNLIPDSNTLTVSVNSFSIGDTITLNNTNTIEFNVDWFVGASATETAASIKAAIETTPVAYTVEQYGEVLLIEKNTEEVLNVITNSSSLDIVNYGVSGSNIFIPDNIFTKNELRNRIVQFGVDTFFIKSNEGKVITLYESLSVNALPNTVFSVNNTFNNGFTTAFNDRFKSYLEVFTKKPTGLEDEQFYYYTVFTSPTQSQTILLNEETEGEEDYLEYTIDKIASTVTRVFYESAIFYNSNGTSFTYNSGTGEIAYADSPDVTGSGIQAGDLFADSKGLRYTIIDVSQATNGIITVSPGLDIAETVEDNIHGSITRVSTPFNFSNIEKGDTFRDVAGNNFEIIATNAEPISGLSTPPAHAFDITQGLVQQVVYLNNFLVPFTFDPEARLVQYGEEQITVNRLLSAFSYNSISGLIQYSGATIDLTEVEIGDFLIDGSRNKFEIIEVNHNLQQITLDIGLSVDNVVDDNRDGSVIRKSTFVDAEGNTLIDFSQVQPSDLFKTASNTQIPIDSVNATDGTVTLLTDLEDINTNVRSEFDGSVNRSGRTVSWLEPGVENQIPLSSILQGGVRRFSSVNDTQYALRSNPLSTQNLAVSTQDRSFGEYIYRIMPTSFRYLDDTGDLEDITQVFGREINELFSYVNLAEFQNPDLIFENRLADAVSSRKIEVPSETLGIDTRRRLFRDIIRVFQNKGSREGIFLYIKSLTTWDITNGTGDLKEAIIDDTPEIVGLRFHAASRGEINTRLVDTFNVESPPAGRFYKSISGVTLPGFFKFKEVIIRLPNVAYEIGNSTDIAFFENTTILSDDNANFGNPNSLKGCFVIPNEGNPADFYEIISNDNTTLTLQGKAPLSTLGAEYVVLSPLNLNRFVALNSNIRDFMPHDTIPVFNFVLTN